MARRVLEMLQFGFKYEWKKRYKPKYNSQCTTILISEKKKMHRNKSDSALTLANLIGCFLILGAGCGLSIMAFTGEIITLTIFRKKETGARKKRGCRKVASTMPRHNILEPLAESAGYLCYLATAKTFKIDRCLMPHIHGDSAHTLSVLGGRENESEKSGKFLVTIELHSDGLAFE